MRSLSSLVAVVIASSLATVACSSNFSPDQGNGDEGALHGSSDAKTLVRGLTHPSGLIATDKHLFFSTNTFVASGDPELDQEFAYWTGKYSRINLDGAAERKMVDNNGITTVRAAKKNIIGKTGSSCWITSLDGDAANPDSKTIYTDPDCSGEGGGEPAGFEVDGNDLYVVREGGQVMAGGLDGSNMKKIAEVKVGNWAGFVANTAFADGKLWVQSHKMEDAQHTFPAALHSVTKSGTVKKVVELDDGQEAANLTSDGKNLFFSREDKLLVLKAGANKVEEVDNGFGAVTDLAVSGKDIIVADAKKDAIFIVREALSLPKKHVKVTDAKDIVSMTAANGKIYFGTHKITGRKAEGTIQVIAVPSAQ